MSSLIIVSIVLMLLVATVIFGQSQELTRAHTYLHDAVSSLIAPTILLILMTTIKILRKRASLPAPLYGASLLLIVVVPAVILLLMMTTEILKKSILIATHYLLHPSAIRASVYRTGLAGKVPSSGEHAASWTRSSTSPKRVKKTESVSITACNTVFGVRIARKAPRLREHGVGLVGKASMLREYVVSLRKSATLKSWHKFGCVSITAWHFV